MIRFVCAFIATALIVTTSCHQVEAQNSGLKPSIDVIVIPIPTARQKEFSVIAGGTQSLREALNGKIGESWGSAAMIYNYDSSQRLGNNCSGFVSGPANLRFHYVAAVLPDIRVAVIAESAPFTVVVRTPNDHFYCANCPGLLLSAALVWLIGPRAGQYDVWVGFPRPGEMHKVTITLLTTAAKNQRNGG